MSSTTGPQAGSRRSLGSLLGVVAGVIGAALGAVVVLVIVAFVAGALSVYRQPSASMLPTIKYGQHILAGRIGFPFSGSIHRGEIVVLHPPQGIDQPQHGCAIPSQPADGHPCARATPSQASVKLIKRVVALGGDRIKVLGGRVYINGVLADEPSVRVGADCTTACELPKEITVPGGEIFVLGDNRGASDDSRFWGPVPSGWVLARKLLVY